LRPLSSKDGILEVSVLSILSELAEVGITKADLASAVDTVAVNEAVIAKTQEVLAYWLSIAPEGDGREHLIYNDEINAPGDYKKSIKATYRKTSEGLEGKVGSKAFIAVMVEYGNKNIKEYACAQRTVNAVGGKFTGKPSEGLFQE
jgi:hypothetical protein